MPGCESTVVCTYEGRRYGEKGDLTVVCTFSMIRPTVGSKPLVMIRSLNTRMIFPLIETAQKARGGSLNAELARARARGDQNIRRRVPS